mmetsp:Transcript_93953/g.255003  ORF Transcript_93953/g.255003 Transcript_93953/m.255003 type:complete len:144 (+) Transcript_93953:94-525(+)
MKAASAAGLVLALRVALASGVTVQVGRDLLDSAQISERARAIAGQTVAQLFAQAASRRPGNQDPEKVQEYERAGAALRDRAHSLAKSASSLTHQAAYQASLLELQKVQGVVGELQERASRQEADASVRHSQARLARRRAEEAR